MTYDPKILNATVQEKAAAFEWLRELAVAGGKDWRMAAVALEEWARLQKIDLSLYVSREAILETTAKEFDDQADSMEMCFEQRLLRTVAERIRGMKGEKHG